MNEAFRILLIVFLISGISSSAVHATPINKCLGLNLDLLWNGRKIPVTEAQIGKGKVLAGDVAETILKNGGKRSDHIFASLEKLTAEELKIFKEELRSGTWKWACE